MKKIVFVLTAAIALAAVSCQREPDLSDLDGQYLVLTNFDPEADYSTRQMYYIPDSILYISDSQTQQYWTDANALKIVNEFVSQMNDRGFERTNDKAAADLGIQVSYTKDVTLIVDNPYWWYDYPYWDPTWWGPWSGWYPYPYPVVYSYSMGSLMAEIIDLDAPVSGNLPVTWSAYMSGLLSGSASIDMELTLDAVDQAFDQSPYIVYGE